MAKNLIAKPNRTLTTENDKKAEFIIATNSEKMFREPLIKRMYVPGTNTITVQNDPNGPKSARFEVKIPVSAHHFPSESGSTPFRTLFLDGFYSKE